MVRLTLKPFTSHHGVIQIPGSSKKIANNDFVTYIIRLSTFPCGVVLQSSAAVAETGVRWPGHRAQNASYIPMHKIYLLCVPMCTYTRCSLALGGGPRIRGCASAVPPHCFVVWVPRPHYRDHREITEHVTHALHIGKLTRKWALLLLFSSRVRNAHVRIICTRPRLRMTST